MGNNPDEHRFKCACNILLYGVVIVDIKDNIIYVANYYCGVLKYGFQTIIKKQVFAQ